MTEDGCTQALVSLGFNALEASVYAFLLRESPVTGYRVAQALGKPVANTYKAIESLANKGAVIVNDGVDDGSNRLCRPVSPKELLGQMERDFHARQSRAAEALARVHRETCDDGVYQLKSVEQVMERSRAMLDRCTRIALLDVFPGALVGLRCDIERTAARGIDVALKVYKPAEIAGVQMAVHPYGQRTLKRWPGQWLNLVIDGSEHLLAYLTADGEDVHQAVWSRSPFLSWVYHGAIWSEIVLGQLNNILAARGSLDDIRNVLTKHQAAIEAGIPGRRKLSRRFARKASSRGTRPRRG
jgi:sugar-specific transcriptional regulator TrmB